MIWWLIALLSLVAAALMAIPLLRKPQADTAMFDTTPSVLLDQLEEVHRDHKRGVISETEAKAAEQEIKRRILMHSRHAKTAQATNSSSGRMTLIFSVFLVPLIAIGYYVSMGSPEISGVAFAERAQERQEAAQLAELTSQLNERLLSDPEGGPTEGWMLLGQTYARMGRFSDAATAFQVVAERPEATSVVFSMLGEALILSDQGVVTPRAEAAIDQAISLDPDNPAGTYYKAVALSQKGEPAAAYELLLGRLDAADQVYPWMQSLVAEANRIAEQIGKEPISMARFAPASNAPGPTEADVQNAQEMSEEDRQAFILSMVERLATRLESEPADLDGWLRLGNAYMVLENDARAIEAFEKAQALLAEAPENDPRQQVVRDALGQLKP